MNTIYLIHGWTYRTDAWNALIALLQKRFDVRVLKVPGLTTSSDKVWTLDEYVEWLKTELGDETNVTLMGHSNGGRIAIAFAAAYSDRVGRLVLEDAAGIVHNELPLRLKRAVFGFLARIGKRFTSSPFVRKVFYRLIGARDYERAPENMRATMANLISRDLTRELGTIQKPTLIIWGAKDTATPVSDARVMHEKIAGSQLHIIEDAAHSPHATHPEVVNSYIVEWMAS
jgi:pimeloyl-ACP methyl ester carboxylesterase